MAEIRLLRISGQVQGVNLRSSVQQYARGLNLKGWVKNENGGSVLCCLECDDQQLENFINWLKIHFQISSLETKILKIDLDNDLFEIKN